MKKLLALLLLMAGVSTSAFAQKGMNGIGINIPVGVGGGYTYAGIGVKYHYNISNYFRIEPSFEYFPIYSKKKYQTVDDYNYVQMKAFVNGNIFLMAPRPARPYVVVGAGYTHYNCGYISSSYTYMNVYDETTGLHNSVAVPDSQKYTVWDDSQDCFSANIGFGYDIRLSHSIGMQIEATAFTTLLGTTTAKSSVVNQDNVGSWSFMGRIGFTYNF